MSSKKNILTSVAIVSTMAILASSYANKASYRFIVPEPEPRPRVAPPAAPDSTKSTGLKYQIKDRTGDHVTDNQHNPFYLEDPKNVVKSVEYDPGTGKYVITEKIGDQNYRAPTYLTYEEYLQYTEKQERDAYWKARANAIGLVEDKSIIPPIQVKKQFFDKLFGGSKIEIKPQGNIELTLGGNYQKVANPNIPIRNRRTGGFDFDMNINVSVIGKIGDKLQMGIKYNTQSGFDFDNQIKLEYAGDEDDIIKKIEAGNVSLPLPTRLINGSQTLFGFKTQLQFGRLTWTSILSQQKSKRESVTIQNGTQLQTIEVKSDQYEDNKHYFLGQFFRDQYDYANSSIPVIKSNVNVTRMEVWITNRTGATQNIRDVVAFADLGEAKPYAANVQPTTAGDVRPRNEINDIYSKLLGNPTNRYVDNVVNTLIGPQFGMVQAQDFEKTFARKLNTTEYTVNNQLGYVSLNTQLQPNEVLGVAYQYEYNGQVYQVGEFASQIPPDSNTTSKVLYLKMLKSTSVRPTLPIWDLMMKNIYPLGAFQVSNEDFRLDIYYNDPGTGEKRYMPRGGVKGIPLIRLLNLDNVNMNNDPQPDGIFDFIPNVTMMVQNGKLIFPVKEPFGTNLRGQFEKYGSPELADAYVYQQLYDSTKFRAQQYPEYNRFVMRGQYKGTNNREIRIGYGNIPQGSVIVTVGGQKLVEGKDYEVQYQSGIVRVINEGVLNSGQQIKIDFENNNQFGTQQRNLMGTRLDFKVNPKLNIGATVMHLSERPFNFKVNIGDDPISNTIMGADVNYQSNMPWLTKVLDKLPVYSTKEMSTINAYGEVAYLKPGHQKAINGPDKEGQVYVDDFEGTSSGYLLNTPNTAWKLASTPRESPGPTGRIMFPEAERINDSVYGFNRAKLSWYRIDNSFFNSSNTKTQVVNKCKACTTNHFTRLVPQNEVFPNRPSQNIDQNLYTFDLAYYPKERGPYNFESSPNPTVTNGSIVSYGVNNDGTLKVPETRWGGIMRSIDNNDLEANNVEFIEFWLMDPFSYNRTAQGGKMYINLGNVSEDILRDSRMQFENGLSCDSTALSRTGWGRVPKLPPLVPAFDNDVSVRQCQDVGMDGFSNDEEKTVHAEFLTKVSSFLDANALQKLQEDPASDNFRFFQDDIFDNEQNILPRYKYFNNPENNSPVQESSNQTTAGTNLPDAEDLNKDNSLNENETYFQYQIDVTPDALADPTNPYIVSRLNYPAQAIEGEPQPEWNWYQFRVPINSFKTRVGSIPDFKSIQFIRMFLTDFTDSVVLRFGTLELMRNQWRTYNLPLNAPTDYVPDDDAGNTRFNVSSVSIEENGSKKPVNYILPPGIERQQGIGAQTNQFIALNERALSTQVCGLKDGDLRAVFKNMSLDIRRYKRLKMYVHANNVDGENPVRDGDVTAFIRMGSDFKDNYYQYEIPLKITPAGNYNGDNESDRQIVWPDSNAMEIVLNDLIDLKQERNLQVGVPLDFPYSKKDARGRIITIKGNPNIGAIKTMMLGINNPSRTDVANNPRPDSDDGQSKCVEVWFNELRVSGFDEIGGAAAIGNVAVKLADLGNVNVSAAMHTRGFGQVEQKIDQRFKDNFYQYDVNSTLQLGRFFPVKAGLQLPFYGGIAQTFSTPEFDPYQYDIPSREYLKTIQTAYGNDSARNYRKQIQTITTTKGWNFSNVRIVPVTKAKKPHIYDPGNFNFTYAYTLTNKTDPFLERNSKQTHIAQAGWNFAPQGKDLFPFKKLIKSKSKWLDIIRDFNFSYLPSAMGVTSDWNREFGEIKLRPLGETDYIIPSTYFKQFRWNRNYTFNYNPFKSLSIQYSAVNNGRVDEPDGLLDTKEKKDSMWASFLKGGRNTNFNQSLTASYNLPINKIPVLDWVNANISYGSTYNWTSLPQVRDSATGHWQQNPLGNIINNAQNNRGKVDLDFRKLYNKSPFLKTYNTPNPNLGDPKAISQRRDATLKARAKLKEEIDKLKEKKAKLKLDLATTKADAQMDTAKKKRDITRFKNELKSTKKALKQKRKDLRNKQMPSNIGISVILRPVLMLKRASLEIKQANSTTLPGFTGYSRLIGVDQKLKAPGYDFAFGNQPGMGLFKGFDQYDANARDTWLDEAAQKGWITRDTFLNQKFTQSRSQRIDASATLEPFPDFKIELKLFRENAITHTQFFKAIDGTGEIKHLNPMDLGSYSISYLPIRTMFKKIDSRGIGEVYTNFINYRSTISERLQQANPNSTGYYTTKDTGGTTIENQQYKGGYGPKNQDVLIPAFLAAYFGGNPNKVNLNPFKAIPLPNWNISYNGLSKIKWLQKVVQNINITHGYSSTLTVSSFQTNLDYRGDGTQFGNNRIDTLNGNFYPQYAIPNIVVNEQFSPLIGIDMTFKNNIQARFDYKKSRTVTMSFFDYQLVEQNSEAITVGAGYKVRGLKLPIKIKGKKVRLDNDLNFRFDFSYRDNVTINHRIDEATPQITSGNKTITIQPSIDYIISDRLNIRIFYDRTQTIPKISSGFPTTNSKGGITLRFSLTQ